MSVSNEHLRDTCQVWDGLTYSVMSLREAKKLEKQGVVQITTNLQAKDLKSAEEFNQAREALLPPGVEPEPKKKRTRKTYKTREMKAGA